MMHDIKKLVEAGRLLTEVRDALNQQKSKCECCGLTVYADESEWVMRQMLNAAIDRAKKVRESLERRIHATSGQSSG